LGPYGREEAVLGKKILRRIDPLDISSKYGFAATKRMIKLDVMWISG
jgi:hypothetical protein